MIEQLALDFVESDQLSDQALINNFFYVGFEPHMVSQVAIRHNTAEMKKFVKDKKAHLYLPFRSQPYVKIARATKFELPNPSSLPSVGLNALAKFFHLMSDLGEMSFANVSSEGSVNNDIHTLDSTSIDVSVKNEISITMYITARKLVMPAYTPFAHKIKPNSKAVFRFPKIDMKKSKMGKKIVATFVYGKQENSLVMKDSSSITTYDGTDVQNYTLKERVVGSGLAFLFGYFAMEKLEWFFSAKNASPTTQKKYINAICDMVVGALSYMYKLDKHADAPAYFSQVIFKQAVDVQLFKDLFTDVNVLRPIFVSSLRHTGELTPFNNLYSQATFMNLLTGTGQSEYIESPQLNSTYPSSKWALKKTAEFWKEQSSFFIEDGYLAVNSIMDVVRVLRNIHKFYCIYHKLFSDQLDQVDELYSTYYLRYIVFDYDVQHFSDQRARDARNLNIRNVYAEYIIEGFYEKSTLFEPYMSSAKMRRIFSDFFVPYNMFGGGNQYVSADGHIFATLLSHYSYLGAMNELWTNMTTHPDTTDRWTTDLDWKSFRSFFQIYEVARIYMSRQKYRGKPCTNPLYDKLKAGDLKIPDTTYEVRFASQTGEVRAWGDEQNHCIANYAERINEENWLLFGVWDNKTNAWFGHCMMSASATKLPEKKFWEEIPDHWVTQQFRGKHNNDLPAEDKRKIIEHLMRILYPAKPVVEKVIEPPGIHIEQEVNNDNLVLV